MDVPEDRRYTDQHEWARAEGSGVRLGITDYAQEALGEVVFVGLPEVGRRVRTGETVMSSKTTVAPTLRPASCSPGSRCQYAPAWGPAATMRANPSRSGMPAAASRARIRRASSTGW